MQETKIQKPILKRLLPRFLMRMFSSSMKRMAVETRKQMHGTARSMMVLMSSSS
jgi:hypothetical protein